MSLADTLSASAAGLRDAAVPAEAAKHTDAVAAFVPDKSRAERRKSFDANDFAAVTGREEEWRFTPVRDLRGLLEAPEFTVGGIEVSTRGPEQVTVEQVAATDPRVGSSGLVPGTRASALAWQGASQATVISVPADTELAEAFVVDHRGLGIQTQSAAHVVVTAGANSRGTVVLRFTGSATVSDNVEVVVGDGANLTVVSIQEWADDTVHLSSQHGRVGRDAKYTHVAVTLGGKLVRLDTTVEYAGPGGDFEGIGVYFADAGQHLENRVFVDHGAPNCRSNVEYKGALQGETARTVWVGDVLIRASAHGTDTYELNRNLVLTDGARADSVPNLEIETGQIKGAGHASATGRFDDLQLFYLMSRGVPEDEAKRLVVRGFFASVIGRIGIPSVVAHLMDVIDAELAATSTIKNEIEGGSVADTLGTTKEN